MCFTKTYKSELLFGNSVAKGYSDSTCICVLQISASLWRNWIDTSGVDVGCNELHFNAPPTRANATSLFLRWALTLKFHIVIIRWRDKPDPPPVGEYLLTRAFTELSVIRKQSCHILSSISTSLKFKFLSYSLLNLISSLKFKFLSHYLLNLIFFQILLYFGKELFKIIKRLVINDSPSFSLKFKAK